MVTAGLSGLDDVGAGGLAEVVEDAYLRGEGGLRNEDNAGRELRDRRRDASGDDCNLRNDRAELHSDVASDDGGAAAVKSLPDAGGVGSGRGEENEATVGRAADLVGAVLQGVGEGRDLLALDELDAGVAERDAEGRGDGASDDYGLGGEGEERCGDEGDEERRRFAVVRVAHDLDCKGVPELARPTDPLDVANSSGWDMGPRVARMPTLGAKARRRWGTRHLWWCYGMRRSLPVVLRDSRSRWAWAASVRG